MISLKKRRGYEEKQNAQTLDERMAHYAELIEKIKSEAPKPVYKIVNYQSREEYAELAAAFALFEEYDLLERYIKEGAGSKYDTFNFMILNYSVRPEFAFWEPSQLHFITSKSCWNKMKEPKKMLEFLVKKHANINERAGNGSAPLMSQICADGSLEILEALLELGADPNIMDTEGNTPLSLVQELKLSDMEELLLKYGALMPDEMEEQDDDGRHDAWS